MRNNYTTGQHPSSLVKSCFLQLSVLSLPALSSAYQQWPHSQNMLIADKLVFNNNLNNTRPLIICHCPQAAGSSQTTAQHLIGRLGRRDSLVGWTGWQRLAPKQCIGALGIHLGRQWRLKLNFIHLNTTNIEQQMQMITFQQTRNIVPCGQLFASVLYVDLLSHKLFVILLVGMVLSFSCSVLLWLVLFIVFGNFLEHIVFGN